MACVSSSANLYCEDPEKRAKDLSDARRFIDLASNAESALCTRLWRQSGPTKSSCSRDATKKRVAAGLRELGEYAGARNVTVIIESHDHFTSSATLKDVIHVADSDHVGLLWDAHHTFATSNEDPEFTVKQLGQWIRHTHLKDSVGEGEDRKYVLTGRGTVPIPRQIKALRVDRLQRILLFRVGKGLAPRLARSRDRDSRLRPSSRPMPRRCKSLWALISPRRDKPFGQSRFCKLYANLATATPGCSAGRSVAACGRSSENVSLFPSQ